MWSPGNCARSLNSTMRTSGICTTQNPSLRIRHKILLDFEIQTDHLISTRLPDPVTIKKDKRTNRRVNFALPSDHRENWRKAKKEISTKTLTDLVSGLLGTITKGLIRGLQDLDKIKRMETIQNTALLRSARILRRVLNTWGDLLPLLLQ